MSLDCAGLAGVEEVDATIAGAAGLQIVVTAGLEVAGLASNVDGFVEAKGVVRGESADAGVGAGKGFGENAVDAGDRAAVKRPPVEEADVVEVVVGLSMVVAGALPKRPEEGTIAVDGVAGALLPPNCKAGAVEVVGVDVAVGIPPKKCFGGAVVAAPPKSVEEVGAAVEAIDEGAVKGKFHQWGLYNIV